MPKSVKEKPQKESVAESKYDYDGFRGALPVNLDRTLASGGKLRDELTNHVKQLLEQELANQKPRLNKIKDWEDNYKGVRKAKEYPWPNAANVCVPITRSDTDAVHVRLVDSIFNKRKVWMVRAREPQYVGLDRDMEEALDWFQRNILKFQVQMTSPLIQCIKTGTGIIKIGWQSKKRTVYRYATPEELSNSEIPKFSLPGTDSKAVKVVQSLYEGPQIYPIPREDFVCSADATTIQDAYMVGFRTRIRLPQLRLRAKQGIYDKDAVDKVLTPSSKVDETKEGRATRQEKEIKYIVDDSKPTDVWELWFQYDVDEDGEPDDIVVSVHRDTGTILRCIYNPMFLGFRPFVALVFYPHEYAVDGEGVAEILDKIQKELDALHNQRLDRLTQINSPIIFVRSGSSLENLEQLEPGQIYVVDDELDKAIREFRWSDTTFSTHQEEDRLIGMGDRAVGITSGVLGISTAERPVAKETFANIQEANKKFKFGIDNLRRGIAEIGYMILEFFAQYQPTYSYTKEDDGKLVPHTINFPLEYIRDGLNVDLFASSEVMNQEMRREIHLVLYQLLSDYYSKTSGIVQAIIDPNVPSEFKKYAISIVQKGDKRLDAIMKDFDQVDGEEYLVNLEDTIDIEKALAESVDLLPPPEETPPQPGAGPQQPEGGQQIGPNGEPIYPVDPTADPGLSQV